MADRLTRITTRGGDKGQSRLATGDQLPKQHAVFEALGHVDELNCAIGQALTAWPADGPTALTPIHDYLAQAQSRLFDVGGALASPGVAMSVAAELPRLEALSEALNTELPPLKNFIMPGGSECGARLHTARAICRRAERAIWAVLEDKPDDYDLSLAVYLNRLSDALFIFARTVNRTLGEPERIWEPMLKPD
jgi:cob(I)alamin adenosyltransferase